MGPDTHSPGSWSSEDFGSVLDQWLEANPPSESLLNEPEIPCSEDFTSHLDQWLEEDSSSESLPNEQQCEKEGELDPEIIRRNKRTAELISETAECEHPSFFGGLCVKCGQIANGQSDVKFEYMCKKSRCSKDEIARFRERNTKSLLQQKKLYLVLDLDHTLVNTIANGDLTVFEGYLRNQTDTRQDLFVLKAADMMMTKLRPYVHTFLKEASKMFDMYLYTTGSRTYALEMAKLLDPKLEYFNSKVISPEEGTKESQKNLHMLMGRECFTLILDDTECVWPDFKYNLILISPYHFFYKSRIEYGLLVGRSLAEGSEGESESYGALSHALEILRATHEIFFLGSAVDGDVRNLLKIVKDARAKKSPLYKKILTEALAMKSPLYRKI